MTATTPSNDTSKGYKFGTFGGVFTPSILTILGLIMYMRCTYVVGNAGIVAALCILLVAELITVSTGLSISAISTNTPVKGGGAYYLISRALGPGFGSSIGVALFFAQALSVPFYIIGFSEAMVQNFPVFANHYFTFLVATGLVLSVIIWIGAGWTIKCQMGILVVLALSIVSFILGAIYDFNWKTFGANLAPAENANLTMLFAIYFPAVTGIMAGVNMSGDLENPTKSIPRGTMAAIFTGMVVYGVQMILCGGAFPREKLIQEPYRVLVDNALLGAGFLVTAGVVCATLSSALGSFMGAPRVLQALARDKILNPLNPFAKGQGAHNEPKRATALTFVITMSTLIWAGLAGADKGDGRGALNYVAAVVTMFFLYTYGMVNLAAFVESFGANPSFRPRFKLYHWGTALFGAVSCVVVTLYLNAFASVLALLIIGGLFVAAKRKEMKRTFGDARRGFIYSRIRDNLINLSKMPADPKNWRPTILVLTGNPHTRRQLLVYACLFECDRGILTLVEFLIDDLEEAKEKRGETLRRLNEFVAEEKLDAFPEVIVTKNFDDGLRAFLQAHSIGPIKPNIVMLGWPHEAARLVPYVANLRTILSLNMSCVTMIGADGSGKSERIDLWWRGRKNGSLMLILAYLLQLNDGWRRTKIQILRCVYNDEQMAPARDELLGLVEAARVVADVKIIKTERSFDETFRRESTDARAIFLGFLPPDDAQADTFFKSVNVRLEGMPPAFLVCSTGEADLLA